MSAIAPFNIWIPRRSISDRLGGMQAWWQHLKYGTGGHLTYKPSGGHIVYGACLCIEKWKATLNCPAGTWTVSFDSFVCGDPANYTLNTWDSTACGPRYYYRATGNACATAGGCSTPGSAPAGPAALTGAALTACCPPSSPCCDGLTVSVTYSIPTCGACVIGPFGFTKLTGTAAATVTMTRVSACNWSHADVCHSDVGVTRTDYSSSGCTGFVQQSDGSRATITVTISDSGGTKTISVGIGIGTCIGSTNSDAGVTAFVGSTTTTNCIGTFTVTNGISCGGSNEMGGGTVVVSIS